MRSARLCIDACMCLGSPQKAWVKMFPSPQEADDGRDFKATRKLRKRCLPRVPEKYPQRSQRASWLSESCPKVAEHLHRQLRFWPMLAKV